MKLAYLTVQLMNYKFKKKIMSRCKDTQSYTGVI